MIKDVDSFVQSFSTCNTLKPHQQKEPMQLHTVPELPWSTVASDLFEWNGQHYLVLVDSYLEWFKLDPIKKIKSQCIINKLKRHFSVHGIPHKLLSDCGMQYTSQTFKDFAKDWNFTHVTSSPEYHQANGLAERAVQSAKHLLETSKRDRSDLFLNLLNISNVPRDGMLGSPAQQLMSRVTRTNLPISKHLLRPKSMSPKIVHAHLSKKRDRQKRYCNRRHSFPSKTPK